MAHIEKPENVIANAEIGGDAEISGNARIGGNARISGNARIGGNAWISGNAKIGGNARISGNVWISENAWIGRDAKISGNAEIGGNAYICNNADWKCITRSDGYTFTFFACQDGKWRLNAGCRHFTMDEAWKHWSITRPRDTFLGAETFDILEMMEKHIERWKANKLK